MHKLPLMAKATLLTTITTLTAILFTTSFPILASADILQFGPGALPGCAYQCRPLWSAQYDCPEEAVAGECFCKSKYLGILNQGGGGSLCEADCPETSGGAEIRVWYDSVCAPFMNKQTPPPTTTTRLQHPTETPTIIKNGTSTEDGSISADQDQHNKAVEWYVHMLRQISRIYVSNIQYRRLISLSIGGRKTGTGSFSHSFSSLSP